MHPFASFLATDRAADLQRRARQDRFAAAVRPPRPAQAGIGSRLRAAIQALAGEKPTPTAA